MVHKTQCRIHDNAYAVCSSPLYRHYFAWYWRIFSSYQAPLHKKTDVFNKAFSRDLIILKTNASCPCFVFPPHRERLEFSYADSLFQLVGSRTRQHALAQGPAPDRIGPLRLSWLWMRTHPGKGPISTKFENSRLAQPGTGKQYISVIFTFFVCNNQDASPQNAMVSLELK
jgi:hypothetical protein